MDTSDTPFYKYYSLKAKVEEYLKDIARRELSIKGNSLALDRFKIIFTLWDKGNLSLLEFIISLEKWFQTYADLILNADIEKEELEFIERNLRKLNDPFDFSASNYSSYDRMAANKRLQGIKRLARDFIYKLGLRLNLICTPFGFVKAEKPNMEERKSSEFEDPLRSAFIDSLAYQREIVGELYQGSKPLVDILETEIRNLNKDCDNPMAELLIAHLLYYLKMKGVDISEGYKNFRKAIENKNAQKIKV